MGLSNAIKRWALLFGCVFLLVSDVGAGLRLPSLGDDDEDFKDFMEKAFESDTRDPRTGEPTRRASQNKAFWQADTLPEMELFHGEPFDLGPWNWESPDLSIPHFSTDGDPYVNPLVPEYELIPWYVYGCALQCFPGVVQCDRPFFDCQVYTTQSPRVADIIGQVLGHKWIEAKVLRVYPSPQAPDYSKITVIVSTEAPSGRKTGVCKDTVVLRCPEEELGCDCSVGETPTIVADAATETALGDICAGGSTSGTFSVDSGGLACPPYDWELNAAANGGGKTGGQSFLLNGQLFGTATTNADGESVTVSSSGACGGAVLTVTDQCGRSDSYYIKCTDSGGWVTIAVGADSCYAPGMFTSQAGITKIRDDGYRRQRQNIIIHGGSGVACTGTICGTYDCAPFELTCGAATTYGCTSCLTITNNFSGWCTGVGATIYNMCDCHSCDDGMGNYQCACACTNYLDYLEWKCP